ncbi:unnamed protein product [Schistosoma turkestanicum]|nr:unnamed protein product [Schistosoma turkestanicum]
MKEGNDVAPVIENQPPHSTNKPKVEDEVNDKHSDTVIKHESKSPVNNSQSEESNKLTNDDLIDSDQTRARIKKFVPMGMVIVFVTVLYVFFITYFACIYHGQKSPTIPSLPFWKSTVGYWLDVFAFKDSSGDLVGDLKGLTSEIDYIKTVIGAGYVILGPITKGFYTNSHNMLGLVDDYEQLDEAVGTMDDFRALLKQFHEKDVKVILTFDFNAISIDHKWIQESKVKLKSFEDPYNNKMSRYGKPIDVDIGGKKFYSVFGAPNVDLDLTDPDTQKQIFNVIDHWMEKGIDGILLENAAFFVEEEENVKREPNSNWLQNCPNSQLYRNGSVTFVKAVKQHLKKWIVRTGKNKLLAVNSGDTGCGVGNNLDPMLMFKDVVDLIISREFVFQRGQTEGAISYSDTDIRKFSSYSHSDRAKLGLTTTTSTNAPVTDFIQMASTLLSQGMPIIYYATEIGITNLNLVQVPKTIYPKDKSYNNDGKHQSLRSHLPMPWDLNGKKVFDSYK